MQLIKKMDASHSSKSMACENSPALGQLLRYQACRRMIYWGLKTGAADYDFVCRMSFMPLIFVSAIEMSSRQTPRLGDVTCTAQLNNRCDIRFILYDTYDNIMTCYDTLGHRRPREKKKLC